MSIYRVRHTHGDTGEGGESTYIFRADDENILSKPTLEKEVIEMFSIYYEPDNGDELEISLECAEYDEMPYIYGEAEKNYNKNF